MPIYILDEELVFPPPGNADPIGILAVGGDLSVERLLLAYRSGIFPWYSEGEPLIWWSPDPRFVLFPDEFKVTASLKRIIKSGKFSVTFDKDFSAVITNCGQTRRKQQDGTWITPAMIDLALRAKDLIGQLLESDGSTALEPACADVVEALAKFLPHKVASAPSARAKPGARADQKQRYKIFFKPHPQVFSSGTDPINLVDELRALGDATVTARVEGIPSLESLEPEQCYLAWEVELLSAQPLAKVKEVFLFVEDESEIRIESLPPVVLRETAEATRNSPTCRRPSNSNGR